MSLYKDLSDYYDEVFSVGEAELEFVARSVRAKGTLLDVGCGTGNKTVLLAQGAERVVGVDPDGAMIERANTDNKLPHVHYQQAAMEDLNRLFPAESFSAITCLGNTLVHLTNKEAIANVIRVLYDILTDGGVFVCQILHYDYILKHNITALPVLETDSVLFVREYDLQSRPIQFLTTIKDKQSGRSFSNATPLYPLCKAELQDMLEEAGFCNIEFFGSYAGDPLSDTSLPLIVRCKKELSKAK